MGVGRIKWLLALILLFGMAMPARASTANSTSAEGTGLEGWWYGEGYQPYWQAYAQWIEHRDADGSFQIEFRRYENCVLVHRQLEAGTWRRDGNEIIDETNNIDGTAVAIVNEYDIETLSEHDLLIYHPKTDTHFRDVRVTADFDFPGCDVTS